MDEISNFRGFAKSRAAPRPATAHGPPRPTARHGPRPATAHGPPRPSGSAIRRPSGPRPTARDGPAVRGPRWPGGPEAQSWFSRVFCPVVNPDLHRVRQCNSSIVLSVSVYLNIIKQTETRIQMILIIWIRLPFQTHRGPLYAQARCRSVHTRGFAAGQKTVEN